MRKIHILNQKKRLRGMSSFAVLTRCCIAELPFIRSFLEYYLKYGVSRFYIIDTSDSLLHSQQISNYLKPFASFVTLEKQDKKRFADVNVCPNQFLRRIHEDYVFQVDIDEFWDFENQSAQKLFAYLQDEPYRKRRIHKPVIFAKWVLVSADIESSDLFQTYQDGKERTGVFDLKNPIDDDHFRSGTTPKSISVFHSLEGQTGKYIVEPQFVRYYGIHDPTLSTGYIGDRQNPHSEVSLQSQPRRHRIFHLWNRSPSDIILKMLYQRLSDPKSHSLKEILHILTHKDPTMIPARLKVLAILHLAFSVQSSKRHEFEAPFLLVDKDMEDQLVSRHLSSLQLGQLWERYRLFKAKKLDEIEKGKFKLPDFSRFQIMHLASIFRTNPNY